jgi:hypothetical protein
VRIGATKDYAAHWEQAFGKKASKSGSAKPRARKKPSEAKKKDTKKPGKAKKS